MVREDGNLKGTLALILALAAVLWFAPVSAADLGASMDPYRDLAAGPHTDGAMLESADDNEKIEICHVPPGNPDNAHTIRVGAPAAEHHMKNHGDTLGPCEDEGDQGNEGSDPGGDGNPGSGTDDGTNTDPQGPTPSAVGAAPTNWLWLLLIALVGGATATALLLRRRRLRAR